MYNYRISVLAFQQKNVPFINEEIRAFSYASLQYQYPTIQPSVFSQNPNWPLSMVTISPSVAVTGVISIQSSINQDKNDVLLISVCIVMTIIVCLIGVAYKKRVFIYEACFKPIDFSTHSNFGVTLDNIAADELLNETHEDDMYVQFL
jgi:hypothetical protein